jgi:hypothetical protein
VRVRGENRGQDVDLDRHGFAPDDSLAQLGTREGLVGDYEDVARGGWSTMGVCLMYRLAQRRVTVGVGRAQVCDRG